MGREREGGRGERERKGGRGEGEGRGARGEAVRAHREVNCNWMRVSAGKQSPSTGVGARYTAAVGRREGVGLWLRRLAVRAHMNQNA